MKIRIAHIDSSLRMASKFFVQRSFFGILWKTMYFDMAKQELLAEYTQGPSKIVRAVFDDFHEALKYARIFKVARNNKQIIRQTWKV